MRPYFFPSQFNVVLYCTFWFCAVLMFCILVSERDGWLMLVCRFVP